MPVSRLIVFIFLFASIEWTNTLPDNRYCQYDQTTLTLTCEHFADAYELNFTLSDDVKVKNLVLKPYEESLNRFDDRYGPFFRRIETHLVDDFNFRLEFYSSFELTFNPFAFSAKMGDRFVVDNSIFHFTIGENDIVCRSYTTSTQIKLLSTFREIDFESNVLYTTRNCPIIFGDANLKNIRFSYVDSNDNLLGFANFTDSTSSSLFTATIRNVQFSMTNLNRLDSSILSGDIFKQVETIELASVEQPTYKYLQIAERTFEPFEKLTKLRVSLFNFDSFASDANWDWTQSLNPKSERDFELILEDKQKTYDFPDEDLCQFKDFPHEQRVFPIIHAKESLNCTCPLVWLLKNHKQASPSLSLVTNTTRQCLASDEFDLLLSDCNFKEEFSKCVRATTTTTRTTPSTTRSTTEKIEIEEKKVNLKTVLAWSISGAAALILVVFVVIVALRIRRRRAKRGNYKDENVNRFKK